jgi:hypothetical protein
VDEGALGIDGRPRGDVGDPVAGNEKGSATFDESNDQPRDPVSLLPTGGQTIDVKTHESGPGVRESGRLLSVDRDGKSDERCQDRHQPG